MFQSLPLVKEPLNECILVLLYSLLNTILQQSPISSWARKAPRCRPYTCCSYYPDISRRRRTTPPWHGNHSQARLPPRTWGVRPSLLGKLSLPASCKRKLGQVGCPRVTVTICTCTCPIERGQLSESAESGCLQVGNATEMYPNPQVANWDGLFDADVDFWHPIGDGVGGNL